jgi:hypothetical protein
MSLYSQLRKLVLKIGIKIKIIIKPSTLRVVLYKIINRIKIQIKLLVFLNQCFLA